MITVALDTSAARGSVAVLEDAKILAEIALDARQNHSAMLFSAVESALKSAQRAIADVNLWAVGIGPGSFTGIRVSIAAVKGFALVHNQPIKGVPSFDALALEARASLPRDCQNICVLCDAKREEVYHAVYDRDGRRAKDIGVGPLESIADEVQQPTFFVGPDIEKFADDIGAAFGGFATVARAPIFARAAHIGLLAQGKFRRDGAGDAQIEPIYLRAAKFVTHKVQ
jgi:tRNA threonylcarbamoyladenosine biosynthesis protein TsaB